MKNIVIAGYPKSGSTWLVRLVAEILDSPVNGFWNAPGYNEMAIEGLTRKGEFSCFKSHHQLSDLKKLNLYPDKIIYIIRDPRDIIISSLNYFNTTFLIDSKNILARLINRFYRVSFGKIVMKKRAIDAILFGDSNISVWNRVGWKSHVLPFLKDEQVYKIRYEDLLDNPEIECNKLLNFLNVNIEKSKLRTSIKNQSFIEVKNKFNDLKDKSKARFLRKGKKEQWKNKLNKEELHKINKEFASILTDLKYEVK